MAATESSCSLLPAVPEQSPFERSLVSEFVISRFAGRSPLIKLRLLSAMGIWKQGKTLIAASFTRRGTGSRKRSVIDTSVLKSGSEPIWPRCDCHPGSSGSKHPQIRSRAASIERRVGRSACGPESRVEPLAGSLPRERRFAIVPPLPRCRRPRARQGRAPRSRRSGIAHQQLSGTTGFGCCSRSCLTGCME